MRRFCWILVSLALLSAPVAARAEWYDHYESAVAAIDRGDFTAAIESIESALSRKKRSGYLRTYGNNYIRYAPYLHLGVAYHGAGDCTAALAAFDESDDHSETDDVPEFHSVSLQLREECRLRLAPPVVEPPVAEPEPIEEPTPRRPPIDRDLLERALTAYLQGDFEVSSEVFRSLVGVNPGSPRLKLLFGMSLHGAWVTGGEQDETLIAEARTIFQTAASQDPALMPDPALCPPRVAALYRSLR